MKRITFLSTLAVLLLFSCCKNDNVVPAEEGGFKLEAIDLGLSVKWANANLGAGAPEWRGHYYAWGETESKSDFRWSTYKFGNESQLTKYNGSDKTVLDPEDDAAHTKLGGTWRMPTSSEMEELFSTKDNPDYRWEWKTSNNHNGWLVTYLINNNSIFLPAAGGRNDTETFGVERDGYYWASSLNTDNPLCGYIIYFNSSNFNLTGQSTRCLGRTIRPVSE